MAALGLLSVVAGCGSAEGQPDPRPAPPAATSTSRPEPSTSDPAKPAGLARSEPTEITVPAINARSTLVPLGHNADETVEVPPVNTPMQAGWYKNSVTPGETGSSVLLGHVDGGGKPGIFYRLKELKAGDEIIVKRADGGTLTFVVDRMQQVAKTEFPADAVYDDAGRPELRLITCGGAFDAKSQNYLDNIIAFATLAH